MLDDPVRISFLLLIGLALVLTAAWYVRFCYQEITGTGQVVIDPLTVVSDDGKGSEELGKALAQMLQARLESLSSEFQNAQQELTAVSEVNAPVAQTVGNVRGWTPNVPLKIFLLQPLDTRLLQPVDMKLSVGGVDVGGILPWLQRRISSQRTLHDTLYSHGDETQVFGSITALGVNGPGVRLIVKGEDGKAPSLRVVVDRLAYEIFRRKLASDTTTKVDLLQPEEFMNLAVIIVDAGEANRQSIQGRPAKDEFTQMLPRVTELSDKVPQWMELEYFAGWIADKSSEPSIASKYYQRVVDQSNATKYPGLKEYLSEHIALLNAAIAPVEPASTVAASEAAGGGSGRGKWSVDYSSLIETVRDAGPEGSVVGQALALAMEMQIKRALHQDVKISARYIYYAARAVAGTTSGDSGAMIKDAVGVLAKQGAVEEKVWPYKAGQYGSKPPAAVDTAQRFLIRQPKALKGLDEIKKALAEVGPVVTGIEMYQEGMSASVAKTGNIPMPRAGSSLVGGHAIVLVGYDEQKKRFKFANDWGQSWGDQGFGYLPEKYIEKFSSDAWSFLAGSDAQKATAPSRAASAPRRAKSA